jgi:ppGpp synthetase/RelA/SpoT-type nucleotidyltranferase
VFAIADAPEPSQDALPVCPGKGNPYRLADTWFGTMSTVAVQHTSGQIDRAGQVLSSSSATKQEIEDAIALMDKWRTAHNRPLKIAWSTLQDRAKQVHPNPTIGTRLKREESIRDKLIREPTMKLSKMQDIGGCRVILRNMKEVDALVSLYANDGGVSVTDYVENPRVSGYRGKHIICQRSSENVVFWT